MLVRVEELPETHKEYRFRLVDSKFTSDVSIEIPIQYKIGWDRFPAFAPRTVVVLRSYVERNLPVASNVARLYCWLVNVGNFGYALDHLYSIKDWIDVYYPQLQYGSKYFECTLRYLKTLDFVHNKQLIKR